MSGEQDGRYRVHEFDESDYRSEPWMTWLTRHGISPSIVTIPGWVMADDEHYQVQWRAPERDAAGRWTGEHTTGLVQLEGRALPFPGYVRRLSDVNADRS